MAALTSENKPSIYLDHAATTPLRQEVKEHMVNLLSGPFGNPSSTHHYGRKSRIVVEEARKFIAQSLHCSSGEIIFTSGGTEADNAALHLPVRDLGIKRIITSPVEHHAVLHTAELIARNYDVQLELVQLSENGTVDINHLEELLSSGPKSLVSLMHGNNEIGNLLDIKVVGGICHKYGALFHSDTVQTLGHFPIDLRETPIDFITASAHKFHGPKGVGFLYMNSDVKVGSYISGGAQERNMRGGTENILGISGLHQALKWSLQNLEQESQHILHLKNYFMSQLKAAVPNVSFNGLSGVSHKSLYTVISVAFKGWPNDSMFLFNLDLNGIAASGGSACASGSTQGSHVIQAILPKADYPVVRFSLGKDTSKEELDYTIGVLQNMAAAQ